MTPQAEHFTRLVNETMALYKTWQQLRERYIQQVESRTMHPSKMEELRVQMQSAQTAYRERFLQAQQCQRAYVANASWSALEAAHKLHLLQTAVRTEAAFPPLARLDLAASMLVMPALFTGGTWLLTHDLLKAGVALILTGMVAAVRALLARHRKIAELHDIQTRVSAHNKALLREARAALNEAMLLPIASATMLPDLEARYQRELLQRATDTARSKAAEWRAVMELDARREEGLAAYRATLAAGAAVAHGWATELEELPQTMGFDAYAWQPEPIELYTFEQPVASFPELNTNGMPMISGTPIDVQGNTYGTDGSGF